MLLAEYARPKKPRTENKKADNRNVTHYTNYTPLNSPMDHLLVVTIDKLIFREPYVIRHERSKRDARKFCKFHKDIGHDMSTCNSLKDVIEGLIKRGYF